MKSITIIIVILSIYSCVRSNDEKKPTFFELNIQHLIKNLYKKPYQTNTIYFDGYTRIDNLVLSVRKPSEYLTFHYQQKYSGDIHTIIEFQIPKQIAKSNFTVNIASISYYYYKHCGCCVQKEKPKLNGTISGNLLNNNTWKITGKLYDDSNRIYSIDNIYAKNKHNYIKLGNIKINEIDDAGTKIGWHIEDSKESIALIYYENNHAMSGRIYIIKYSKYGNTVHLSGLEMIGNPYSTEFASKTIEIFNYEKTIFLD